MIGRALTLLVLMLAVAGYSHAGPNSAIDNILMSKVNGISKVEIWPGCRMRYVDHSPREAGLELRIRVATDPECANFLAEISSERYAPSSLRLGNVEEIVFDRLNDRETFITLFFRTPMKFEVRQHSVGWIEVYVDTTIPSSTLHAAVPEPLASDLPQESDTRRSAMPEVTDRRSPTPSPRPAARVNVPPSDVGDYVVQLGVFGDPAPGFAALERSATPHFAYTTSFELNGTQWHGLNLGFFNSETEANAVLDNLAGQFPDAWVRIVSDNERTAARAGGEVRDRLANEVPAVRVVRSASPGQAVLDGAMVDGRRALLEQRYADAIRYYTMVLESPGHAHGAEAREMLGIALERSGNHRAAIAEYTAFVNEFPDHLMVARVQDRLTTLSMAADVTFNPANVPAQRASPRSDGWQFHGGISQYYWRNQAQVVHDGNYLVSDSGVLGLANITASKRGERFDVLARFNGAYQFNLVEFDRRGDIGWVSDAFVDVSDSRLNWQGRIGRQTRRSDGVPTRFDGIGVRYDWRPEISFSVSGGVPIDSPRYISDSQRAFVAGSASMQGLMQGRLAANIFTHYQTVDGILDRQAVGGEVTFRQGNFTLLGLVDFDVSYNVLNSFLANANWRMDNGWIVSGRVNVGALPYLTTRNALSGTTATSVDELLQSFSEAQVRGLARDRTAQASTVSLGLSAPLGEQFDLSFDVTMRQSDATVASAGVAAIPETGAQVFLNAMLVGTGLISDNDLLMLSLRNNTTRTRDTTTLVLDSRLPFGKSLRINPRLTVEQHSPKVSNASKQTVVSPSIRVLYRWKRVLLDFEAGGRWSNRELPPNEADPFTPDGTEELLGGFVNVGYRLEF